MYLYINTQEDLKRYNIEHNSYYHLLNPTQNTHLHYIISVSYNNIYIGFATTDKVCILFKLIPELLYIVNSILQNVNITKLCSFPIERLYINNYKNIHDTVKKTTLKKDLLKSGMITYPLEQCKSSCKIIMRYYLNSLKQDFGDINEIKFRTDYLTYLTYFNDILMTYNNVTSNDLIILLRKKYGDNISDRLNPVMALQGLIKVGLLHNNTNSTIISL